MKKHILAAVFAALSATVFAERPSLDEQAVRLGVRDWFLLRSTSADAFSTDQLKTIYRTDVEFNDPTNGASAAGQGLQAYAALWQPLSRTVQKLEARLSDDVKVSVKDSQAVTTFTFRPEGTYKDGRPLTCNTRVSLTWKRQDGMWKIVREELTPIDPAPTRVVTSK